ncbi:MAG: tetratricopeptide repeat protein [Spirochaetaceae bacterium]|jgi:tetratricopeptide (TPR) repeat protein|nr:tetratricopeptide repeat protein [Spirochaetaceae bacterium]
MPSLKQLKQLQDLFSEIGGEKEILDAEGLRPDVYNLPANEPPPRDEPRKEAAPPKAPAGTPPPGPPADSAETDDGSIFERLFGSMDDLVSSAPHEDELPEPYTEDERPDAEGEIPGIEDFSLDLEPPAGESAGESAEGEIPGIEDFSLDLGPPAGESAGEPAETDAGGFDKDFDLDEMLKGFDMDGGEADGLTDIEGVEAPEEKADSDDIPSVLEISDEEKASLFPDEPVREAAQPDGESSKPGGGQIGSLPNIEDFLSPIDGFVKADEIVPQPPAGEKPKKPVEAIKLTEEQLQQLLDTIASYPLNLRVTCEKIIVEEIVEPSLMSQFIKLLIRGGNAREAAVLAGKILKQNIVLPKGYKTGEELAAEQSSLVYIFYRKIFPIARVSLLIAALAASIAYLSHEFIYKPVRADLIYRDGYERIEEGEYTLGNRRFEEAFAVRPVKNWFYRYAELFRDERQYLYAEEKYDQLLLNYPRDKKGTLDYAAMEADYLRNYEKADGLLRGNILDYKGEDREGLLALGDVNLAWGEYDPSRYEEARLAYAKYITAYGQTDPLLERMMLYFIRTDKLGEVIPLQNYFMSRPKSKISAPSLAELGGYLLDKRFEEVKGVPDENIEAIENVKDVILRALGKDFALPESHYHLARYYGAYGAVQEERQTLETAAAAFDTARPESPKRTSYRVDTQRRLARLLIAGREFISAEETLAKGVNIMEDAIERRVVRQAPEFGELYAYLGDLSYFTKSGDMDEAAAFYLNAEKYGWSPPEMQYRLGSAYYRMGDYAPALNRFFRVSMETPYNRRLLNALGNVSYMRADYFAAEGYFKRLIGMLESDRNRFPLLLPHERPEHRELVERMMIARNNLGVTYNALAGRTGNPAYRAAALGEFAEAARAWDALERNPDTMIRAGITDPAIPGASLPYLNIQNTLYPVQGGNGLLFMQIDKDLGDHSWWEELMRKEGLP